MKAVERAKVVAQSSAKIFGFANVEHSSVGVKPAINTWLGGYVAGFGSKPELFGHYSRVALNLANTRLDQNLGQEFSGEALWVFSDLLGGSEGDYLSAARPSLWS
ncbi:MAG: hypothetical protein RLZ28_1188 [Actinomycetota bacterium]